MKVSRISLFVCLLGMAGLALWGCGGGGSSSGGTIANPALGSLSGRILQGPPNANIAVVRAAEVVGTTGVSGAEVWLEERPEIRTRTALDGTFVFADIPEGSYRVVAKLEGGLRVLKARSASTVTVLKATSATIDLTLQPATVRVTGVLRGTDGQPLPVGTKLTLWGETFEVKTGGWFETPPLPEGFFRNEIVVAFAGTASSFSLPVTFVEGLSPVSVDFMVPSLDGQSAGPWQHPPLVDISAKNGANLTSRAGAGGQLTITAVARDAGDLDRVVPTWNTTRGTLTETADRFVRIWTAPATGGLATVSVLVTDGEGATGTVWLPLLVEGSLSTEKSLAAFSFGTPAVTGTIDQTTRTISLTVPFGTDLSSLVPTITHTGASVSPLTGIAQNFTSPVTYTVTAADGTTQPYVVTVTVAADAVTPSVVLSDDHPDAIVGDADSVVITADFTENDAIDEANKPKISIGSLVSAVDMTKVGGDNKKWQYSWNVPAGNDGNVAVTITARDVTGNVCSAAAGKTSYTIDNSAPTVAITSTRGSPTTNVTPIPVTITFNEAVTGFTSGEITVTNGTLGNFSPVSTTVYTFDLTITGNGHPKVDVAANVAQDTAGNNNTAASPYTHQVSGADGLDVTFVEGGINSVYVLVPQTTLPDATTVVPAFYCGKYPATGGAVNAGGVIYQSVATYQPDGDGSKRQAATTAGSRPWVFITWSNAKSACTLSGGALISENQWLAIANNVLNVNANWTSGTKGTGMLFRGHSDASPFRSIATTVDDSDGYFDTGNSAAQAVGSGKEQFRVKTLSNGAKIWDIGGNVWQWVDYQQAANSWYTGHSATTGTLETNFAGITTVNIKTGYDATYGVGQIYNYSTTIDRPVYRGGNWYYAGVCGAFGLYLTNAGGDISEYDLSFRCTRP